MKLSLMLKLRRQPLSLRAKISVLLLAGSRSLEFDEFIVATLDNYDERMRHE
jgi:hypothetical protein